MGIWIVVRSPVHLECGRIEMVDNFMYLGNKIASWEVILMHT